MPLQRTVTVGGVGSGTRLKSAAVDVWPAPFVAEISSGASGVLGVLENVYVRLAPVPVMVKPAMVGKE